MEKVLQFPDGLPNLLLTAVSVLFSFLDFLGLKLPELLLVKLAGNIL